MSKELIRAKKRNATDEQKRMDELEAEIEQCCTGESITFATQQKQLAASQAQIKVLRDALENCRLLAARHRKEEWATHILRFCESGGSVANPLRQDDSALREVKAGYEAQIKVLREALEWIESATMSMYATRSDLVNDLQSVAYKALATPTDTTALRELLKAERERCAKVCDRKKKEFAEAFKDMADESLGAGRCAAAIRAMEDQ